MGCALILIVSTGLLIYLAASVSGIVTSGNGAGGNDTAISVEWTHHISLPSGLQLKWTVGDPEWVTMEMSSPRRGYVGVGFSPKGGMAGSDIALGWVDAYGFTHLKDYYGTKNGAPFQDQFQDLHLIYGVEDEAGTRIAFRRKWDTCDKNDIVIGNDTLRLIWASSNADPVTSLQADLPYHGHGIERGSRSVYMKGPGKPTAFPDDPANRDPRVQHWDMTVYNVHVPPKETYYYCQIFKFPKLWTKHHVIGYRPLIQKESVPYVHHINVFNCHVPETVGRTQDYLEKYVTHPGGGCYEQTTPSAWKEYCYAFRVASAVGGEGEMYPNHIGDPVGTQPGDIMYFLLEVHYENTYGQQLLDNSGIRIFYTDILRTFDLAMLFVGHRRTPFLTIPPGQTDFKVTGHCAGECTSMTFPWIGIKIYSVLLHAHSMGRSLILRHVRGGKELEPIAYDNHYDFQYQRYRVPSKEVRVLPGDELIMECNYDTSENRTFIFGGLSARREMCEAFIFYYPKSSLVDCRSQPEYYSYLEAIGLKNATGTILKSLHIPYDPALLSETERRTALPDDSFVLEFGGTEDLSGRAFELITIRSPEGLAGKNLQEYLDSLDWNNTDFAKSVESKWGQGPRYMHCAAPGGIRIQNPHHTLKIPNYTPRPSKPRDCEREATSSAGCMVSQAATAAIMFLLFAMTHAFAN